MLKPLPVYSLVLSYNVSIDNSQGPTRDIRTHKHINVFGPTLNIPMSLEDNSLFVDHGLQCIKFKGICSNFLKILLQNLKAFELHTVKFYD